MEYSKHFKWIQITLISVMLIHLLFMSFVTSMAGSFSKDIFLPLLRKMSPWYFCSAIVAVVSLVMNKFIGERFWFLPVAGILVSVCSITLHMVQLIFGALTELKLGTTSWEIIIILFALGLFSNSVWKLCNRYWFL